MNILEWQEFKSLNAIFNNSKWKHGIIAIEYVVNFLDLKPGIQIR